MQYNNVDMLLGFKTEVKPNKQQLILLSQNAGTARHAWNWGLALTKQILMMVNGKLSKAIADMGFYEFKRQLEYKCKLYGSQLVIVDRWFPSSLREAARSASTKTCSNCGHKKESLALSERTFKCGNCGFECDRDLSNASINLAMAVSSTVTACGVDNADVATGKQEVFVSKC